MRVHTDGSVTLDPIEAVQAFACVQMDILRRVRLIEEARMNAGTVYCIPVLISDVMPRLRMYAEWARNNPKDNHAINTDDLIKRYEEALSK